jgi:HEPN domain-containing protein
MNRDDLQQLSNLRIREAKALLKAAQYSGAYYLAGYSVECALKACIAKETRRYDFPDKGKVNSSFTHNLPDLARIANLKVEIELASSTSRQFASRWTAVCNWNEKSRYGIYTRSESEEIISAISTRSEGVLPWIKRRW